jgi:hypothetical protein
MAKHVPLQLMMVNLTNGQRGLFVGLPLVSHEETDQDTQVDHIMLSDVQQLPEDMTLAQLMQMVQDQICPCRSRVN